jgi:SAM-dependent methyltransferase
MEETLTQDELLNLLKDPSTINIIEKLKIESNWEEAQKYERNWWVFYTGNYPDEIRKNNIKARFMMVDRGLPGKSVLDIGCGPLSLLQRIKVGTGTALDPCHYGDLEKEYEKNGIRRLYKKGEDLSETDGTFDEAWIYNCLQHVLNPTQILENAMKVSSIVRIFEWIHIDPYEGHLHKLTPELLRGPFMKEGSGWSVLYETTGNFFIGENEQYYVAIFKKNTLKINSIDLYNM